MKKPISAEAMLLRMADLCARSEQCEADLRAKMQRAALLPAEADMVISRLRADRYLDDARFARAYAGDKMRFLGWGKHKIRMGLAAKRIPSTDVEKALEELPEKEYRDVAMRVGAAKAKSLALNTREDNVKLYRHLLSRGFESALAVEVCKALRHSGN